MSNIPSTVRFDQVGSRLTGVEIVRARRSPAIVPLHRALFALGIVVSSYRVRPGATDSVEHVVIEHNNGGSVDGTLAEAAKAAILPIVFDERGDATA